MSFSSIKGHHNQIEILKKAIISGRLAHAYLFGGQEGIGKRFTALTFAKALNCEVSNGDSCDTCNSCRKIDHQNHPDVETIEAEGKTIKTIKINTIREIQKKLQYRPLEGKFKVIIIDGAEKINPAASNALLKTLEEPPDRSMIILISSGMSALLPTILSRCQRLNFHPLDLEDVVALIKEKSGVEESTARLLASFGQNSVGKALSLDEEWINKERKEFICEIGEVINGDMGKGFKLAENIHKDDSLMNYLELLKLWIRDLLVFKRCRDHVGIFNSDLIAIMQRESRAIPPQRLIKIFQGISECERDILRNANKRLSLEIMFMKLAGVVKNG